LIYIYINGFNLSIQNHLQLLKDLICESFKRLWNTSWN